MTTETESVEPRHPFVEMTRTRLLLLVREPEMIFWVFVFPLLMALALGIASRPRCGVRSSWPPS